MLSEAYLRFVQHAYAAAWCNSCCFIVIFTSLNSAVLKGKPTLKGY